MTVVAIWSARGSPGATTTALALAAAWPPGRNVVVVEADAAGGELVCHMGLWADPSLVTLAAQSRSSVTTEGLWAHAQPLGDTGVRAVAAPPDPRRASAALSSLAQASLVHPDTSTGDLDVVIDLGRLDPAGPAASVAANAQWSLVVARPNLVEAAHVRERAGALGREVGLVATGVGPWRADELAESLGLRLVAALPSDPRAARALVGGRSGRGLARTALVRSAQGLAAELVAASPSPATPTSSGPYGPAPNDARPPVAQWVPTGDRAWH